MRFMSKSYANVYYQSLGDLRSRNPLLAQSMDLKEAFNKPGMVSSYVSALTLPGGDHVVRSLTIYSFWLLNGDIPGRRKSFLGFDRLNLPLIDRREVLDGKKKIMRVQKDLGWNHPCQLRMRGGYVLLYPSPLKLI